MEENTRSVNPHSLHRIKEQTEREREGREGERTEKNVLYSRKKGEEGDKKRRLRGTSATFGISPSTKKDKRKKKQAKNKNK